MKQKSVMYKEEMVYTIQRNKKERRVEIRRVDADNTNPFWVGQEELTTSSPVCQNCKKETLIVYNIERKLNVCASCGNDWPYDYEKQECISNHQIDWDNL